MKYFYDVQGSQMPTVPQIEINVDTVYFRSNIVKISETTSEESGGVTAMLWQYDEIQMTYSNKSIIQKINGRMIRFISKDSKECFENRLEDYLGMMRQSQGLYYENAFRLMKSYYNDMEKYINDLKNQTTK